MLSVYKYCSLELGGERYDYCYNPSTEEVSTQDFPGIKIHKLHIDKNCVLSHDTVRTLIKIKLDGNSVISRLI
jgi:hypothetical protein